MKKILITAGAVPAKLDDIKIITNKFKGGLMAALAETFYSCPNLFPDISITYLTYKGSKIPYGTTHKTSSAAEGKREIEVIYHDGIWDYKEKVLTII